jgi:hypothetical protein
LGLVVSDEGKKVYKIDHLDFNLRFVVNNDLLVDVFLLVLLLLLLLLLLKEQLLLLVLEKQRRIVEPFLHRQAPLELRVGILVTLANNLRPELLDFFLLALPVFNVLLQFPVPFCQPLLKLGTLTPTF